MLNSGLLEGIRVKQRAEHLARWKRDVLNTVMPGQSCYQWILKPVLVCEYLDVLAMALRVQQMLLARRAAVEEMKSITFI